ncbi:MAG: hypothetical protein K0U84_12280 [Actinomycetia bacterium]|nr:hypothetical protein [Actinomycetes bacterium]
MSEPIRKVALYVAAAGVMVAISACQSAQSPQEPTSAHSSASPSASTTEVGASEATQSTATLIDITIADGAVAPTNATVKAVVGEPIVLVVSSDAVDSLHVHSVPEHVFAVTDGPDQRFEFTVSIPGRVDVELHNLHRTVVTIEVAP